MLSNEMRNTIIYVYKWLSNTFQQQSIMVIIDDDEVGWCKQWNESPNFDKKFINSKQKFLKSRFILLDIFGC